MPQWQTKTPIRGGSPETSRSGGNSFFLIKGSPGLRQESAMPPQPPLACMTVSGMSLGP